MTTRTERQAGLYAATIVETLAGEFPDLRDPVVADVVRVHVAHFARTGAWLEVILDDPYFANWRRVRHDGRLRVGCWRLNPSQADQEREQRVNAALDALSSEEG